MAIKRRFDFACHMTLRRFNGAGTVTYFLRRYMLAKQICMVTEGKMTPRKNGNYKTERVSEQRRMPVYGNKVDVKF